MPKAAKCRIEIFPQPKEFDDNWIKPDWTVQVGSKTSNGDIVTISILTGGTSARISRSANFNTNPYRYAIIKCTALTGTSWTIRFRYGGTTIVQRSYTTTGIKQIDLYAANASVHFDCDEIQIEVYGSGGQNVQLDFLAVCKQTLIVPTDAKDAIDEMTLRMSLLSKGIGGGNIRLLNTNAEYTDKVNEFDTILIYLWREGSTMTKIFGGKIIKVTAEGSLTSGEYYLNCEVEDFGHELLAPPNLITKTYENTDGNTIVNDAIAACSFVTNIFVEDIASTHNLEFEDETPYNVIKEIMEKGEDAAGNVGYDGYVDPAGNLVMFARNSKTSGITPTIYEYSRSKDAHPVRNWVKVRGANEKTYPTPRDNWCETTLTPTEGSWSADFGYGAGAINVQSTPFIDAKIGSAVIEVNVTTATMYVTATFTFNAGYEPDLSSPHSYRKLEMWIAVEDQYSGTIYVILEDDAGNKTMRSVQTGEKKTWNHINLEIGKGYEAYWDEDPANTASFNWAKIKKISIQAGFRGVETVWWLQWLPIQPVGAEGTGKLLIDAMHLAEATFEAVAEDTASQSKYGVRKAKPKKDKDLKSDEECKRAAEDELKKLKESAEQVETLLVEGNYYKVGYKQNVSTQDFNITWRILECVHTLVGTIWDTELKIGV